MQGLPLCVSFWRPFVPKGELNVCVKFFCARGHSIIMEAQPDGALTPCHNASPGNLLQGTVFTRASKVDDFLEKLFKYLMQCAR